MLTTIVVYNTMKLLTACWYYPVVIDYYVSLCMTVCIALIYKSHDSLDDLTYMLCCCKVPYCQIVYILYLYESASLRTTDS